VLGPLADAQGKMRIIIMKLNIQIIKSKKKRYGLEVRY
jgi:hypothetical protein